MPRFRTLLIAATVLLVGLAFLTLRYFSQGPGISKKGRAYYVEILEENRDTFASQLFELSSRRGPSVLRYRDGHIELNPSLVDTLKKGEGLTRFGVVRAPDPFDLSKIILCVNHIIVFAGRGREAGENRYYFLNDWPATIPLEPYTNPGDEVLLNFSNPLGELLKLRFVGDRLEISGEGEAGDANELVIRYQDKKYPISRGEEVLLGESSRRLRVQEEYIGPVPLGPPNPREIQIKTVDQGEIVFSTTLKVRSGGWSELVSREAK